MMKGIKFFSILAALFFIFTTTVNAAAFTLQSIGTSTIGGNNISSWSYSGLRPTFRGTANPSEAIAITIDGAALQVYADSAGNWVFTPTSDLTAGSHNVSITNGTITLNFTLSLTAGGSLPRTGGTLPTILACVFGFSMITAGKVFLERR